MLKEGMEQVCTLVFGKQGAGDFLSEVVDIMGDEVGHLAICGMPPAVLDDIELRRIGGQGFDMDACAINIFEQSRSFLVPTEAIPDEEQRTLEMRSEVLDKGKNIVACEVRGRNGKIEPHVLPDRRDSDGAVYREAIVALPTVMDRSFALGCPRATDSGLEHKAGLINENHGAALTLSFF
jgi:hypothetical protein